jgi:hypothetical protein
MEVKLYTFFSGIISVPSASMHEYELFTEVLEMSA